jgi:hypothetical protein
MFIVTVMAAPPELAAVVSEPPAVVSGVDAPDVVSGAAEPPVVAAVVSFELEFPSLPQDAATRASPTASAA